MQGRARIRLDSTKANGDETFGQFECIFVTDRFFLMIDE